MAKKITEESLRLNIIINGDAARKALLDQEELVKNQTKALRDLEAQQKSLAANGDTGSQKYKKLTKAIESQNKTVKASIEKLETLRRQQSITTMTLDELRKHSTQLRTALAKAVPGTENYKKLARELSQVRARMKELDQTTAATDKTLCGMAARFRDYFIGASFLFNSLSKAYSWAVKATDAFKEQDEAMTDAMKTTGLTREEIAALNEELKKLDTRTAQNELLSLARIGGKLGITGEKDLLAFVSAADKINVALKEDLGGDAEGAIATVGKLVDIFQLESAYGLENALLKTGSAINELGMASTANEGYIVDFTSRLAGLAPNADISISKILGMGATLDKYGQQAETAGTAIGQTIMAMFKRTETFAQIARMPLQEFADLLNKDVNEALLRVLEGMNDGGGLASVVTAMDAMHLNGQRASTILGTLSKNVEELRSQQELAADAFDRGSSLMEEFNTKNTSATAIAEKQKKAIEEEVVTIGEKLLPVANGVMSLAEVGLGIVSELVSIMMRHKVALIGVAGVLAAYNIALKASNGLKKLFSFWSKANRADLVAEVATLNGATTSTIALSVAKNLLALNFKAAGTAFKLFTASIKTGLGPIGWVVLAIEGLVALFSPLFKIWNDQRKLNKEIKESNEELAKSYSDVTLEIDKEKSRLEQMKSAALNAKIGSAERAAAIRKINSEYKDYLPSLLTEKSSNEDVATALASVNTQLERKIKLQAKEKALADINESVDNQTKEVMTGFVEMLEKSTGKTTTAAMRAQMNAAVLEYRTAIESATTEAQKKAARSKLFSTYFDLGGDQKFFRGDKLRGLINGLDSVIDSGERATEMLDQLYGKNDASSGASGWSVPTGEDDDPDPLVLPDDDKWSLSKDKTFLEGRAKLRNDYVAGSITSEQELEDEILQLEIDTLKKRLKLNTLSADERAKISDELAERLLKQKETLAKRTEKIEQEVAEMTAADAKTIEEIRDNALAEELKRYKKKKEEYQGNTAALEALERQHAHKTSQIHLQYMTDQLTAVENRYKAEREAMLNSHEEELYFARQNGENVREIVKRHREELKEIDLDYATNLQGVLNSVLNLEGEIDLSLTGLTEPELQALKVKLEEIAALRNSLDGTVPREGDPDPSERNGTMLGLSSDEWGDLFDSGEQGWKRMALAAEAFGDIANQAMNIVSKAMQRQSKLEKQALKDFQKNNDKKKADLENRLNSGLITEAQYNASIKAMDAEYEAYEEQLALKQAKREKALSLTQAIINTAMGVTMALATMAPPLNFINAGIVAAMGAAEIALIASTPITTDGAESGGDIFTKRRQDGKTFSAKLSPNKRGLVSGPTVLVGENGAEYVIPNDGIRNPTLLPIIESIDQARRAGTLANLDFRSVYSPAVVPAGFAAGGFTQEANTTTTTVQQAAALSNVPYEKILQLLEEISDLLKQPIPAIVTMLGPHGLVKAWKEYEKLKKNGQA